MRECARRHAHQVREIHALHFAQLVVTCAIVELRCGEVVQCTCARQWPRQQPCFVNKRHRCGVFVGHRRRGGLCSELCRHRTQLLHKHTRTANESISQTRAHIHAHASNAIIIPNTPQNSDETRAVRHAHPLSDRGVDEAAAQEPLHLGSAHAAADQAHGATLTNTACADESSRTPMLSSSNGDIFHTRMIIHHRVVASGGRHVVSRPTHSTRNHASLHERTHIPHKTIRGNIPTSTKDNQKFANLFAHFGDREVFWTVSPHCRPGSGQRERECIAMTNARDAVCMCVRAHVCA